MLQVEGPKMLVDCTWSRAESTCLRRWVASVPDVKPVPEPHFLQVNQYSLSVFVSLVLSVGGMCATLPHSGN